MNNKGRKFLGLAVTTATMMPMVTPIAVHADTTEGTATVNLSKEGIEARQGTQVITGKAEEKGTTLPEDTTDT